MLQYTNLKNVLTSYEYLLKSLVGTAHPSAGGKTLTSLILQVMKEESWFKLFDKGRVDPSGKSLLNGSSAEHFLSNFDDVLGDEKLKGSTDGYWAREFLITCLARNMTVHFYPSDDRYYGDLFGPMLDAVTVAMFYAWKMAEQKAGSSPRRKKPVGSSSSLNSTNVLGHSSKFAGARGTNEEVIKCHILGSMPLVPTGIQLTSRYLEMPPIIRVGSPMGPGKVVARRL